MAGELPDLGVAKGISLAIVEGRVCLPPMNRLLVVLCLLTTIAQSPLAAASSIAAGREANVLILNGTDPYFPIYLDIDRAMRASLANQRGERIVLLSEEFDAQHFDEQALEPETFAVLAKRYKGLHIDVIVLVTNSALEFYKRHGEQLWPGARVVYQNYTTSVDRAELPLNAIGVSPHNDVAATIDVARRMQPNARRILIVSGSSDIDKSAERLAREHLTATARIGAEFLSGLPLPELLARIAAEPADSIVVYLSQFRDRDGRLYMPRDLLGEITKRSRAPVYGDDETYLGFGIFGGSMESYERAGRLVAEQVQAAIAGEPIDPSRVVLTVPSRCIADARALRRWSLDERLLPPGCELWFNNPGYWEKYMLQTLATLVLIFAAVLIATLLRQLRRRRLAERELRNHLIETTHASRLAIAGELTATIAHEMRQPLAAILSNTETAEFLLDSEGDVREALRPILADIRRDDLRASEVTRRLRSLLAKHEVERRPTDLNAVVADVYGLLQGEAKRRGMRIELQLVSVAQISGDRVELQHVLINLILNAMDALQDVGEERRTIIVSTASSGRCSTITVRDFGHGIGASELPKIFRSFYSSKRTGMGLGLSIARTIVESHGGCMEVTSRWGEGSEFRAVFPSMQATGQELRNASAS